MSLFNNEATKSLLLESDLLASLNTVPSIWELYTIRAKNSKEISELMQLILSSLKKNVIDKMHYGNANLEKDICRFQSFVGSVSQNVPKNELTTFLIALSSSLTNYVDTKNESATNIKINMSECATDVSMVDEAKIASLMERFGLLDSSGLESLIDDGTSALMTTCDSISRCCGNSSSVEDCDVQVKPDSLTFQSFVPNLSEVKHYCELISALHGVDQFPETPQEVAKLINVDEEALSDRIYHQGSYLTNQANLKIITATAHCIERLSEIDAATAVYVLSSVNEKLQAMRKEIGSAQSIIYSQMVVTAMLIRYLYLENEGEKPVSGIITIDFLKYNGIMAQLKEQLRQLLTELDGQSLTIFQSEVKFFGNTLVDDYVQFVEEPGSVSDTVSDTSEDVRRSDELYSLSDEEVSQTFDELLSSLGDVLIDLQAEQSVSESAGMIGATESLSSPWVEQVNNATNQSHVRAILEFGTALHDEVNQKLLEGNREGVRYGLAKEIALSNLITGKLSGVSEGVDAIQTLKDTMVRDISTYTRFCENDVPGGIARYADSAQDYIRGVWNDV